MTGPNERRRESRCEVRIDAVIECLPELDEGDHTAPSTRDRFLQQAGRWPDSAFGVVIRNLSFQGAFVTSTRSPALRSRVRLMFGQSGPEALSITGVVVWRRIDLEARSDSRPGASAGPWESGFGIMFEALNPKALGFIRALVRDKRG